MLSQQFLLVGLRPVSSTYSRLGILFLLAIEGVSLAADESEDQATKARQLVQQALQSEASGSKANRKELLDLATKLPPSHGSLLP